MRSCTSVDRDFGSYSANLHHLLNAMDEQKQNPHRRRRPRPDESVQVSLSSNGDRASAHLDGGSSVQARSDLASVSTPSEQHHAPVASLSLATAPHSNHISTRSPDEVIAPGSNILLSSDSRRHTGKRRASGEVVQHQEEIKVGETDAAFTDQTTTGCEIRRPDLPDSAVVSPGSSAVLCQAETPQEVKGEEPHTPCADASTRTLHVRVSGRRTTTTTRWSPSLAGARQPTTRTRLRGSGASLVTPPARPISNATRNINFGMLQPHFERPLQQAADSFGVCTTLLKKICRRNGISNWPYRKICGLRKSIASMAKQVNYFDGEQKRAYADQLEKLERELEAYLRTGNEPTEEFLQALDAEAAAVEPEPEPKEEVNAATSRPEIDGEKEDARKVLPYTARPSIEQLPYNETKAAPGLHSAPGRASTTEGGLDAWRVMRLHPRGTPLQTPVFPTISTHHRALPPIASILQHQSYSSPSRAASTYNPGAASDTSQYRQDQQPQWRYFPPASDDDSSQQRRT